MPTIRAQSPEQRFVDVVGRMAEQIVVSSDFRKQLDEIVAGSSNSIKINDDKLDGSVKKIRFFSQEFAIQMSDVNKNFKEVLLEERSHPSVKHYEEVLRVLVIQIEKQQVVYREKLQTGEVRYFASDDILTKVKNGEFVIRSKSGEKKIAVAGSGSEDPNVKEINISAIAPDVFTEAAKVFTEVALEANSAVIEEVVVQKEEEPSSMQLAERPTEQSIVVKEEIEEMSSLLHENAAEQAAAEGFADGQKAVAEQERAFREEEKKKDLEDKQKKIDIEKEEIKRQELSKEIVKEAVKKEAIKKEEIEVGEVQDIEESDDIAKT